MLSDHIYNDGKYLFLEDTNPNRPDEDFFAFVKYKINTRTKLVENNKDMYILSGQNGLFALLVIITYFSVWLFKFGQKKS